MLLFIFRVGRQEHFSQDMKGRELKLCNAYLSSLLTEFDDFDIPVSAEKVIFCIGDCF